MKISRRVVLPIALGLLALAATAGPAAAQSRSKAPQPSKEPEGKGILTTMLAAVMAACVVGAAMMPSKRGHQD